MAEYIEREAAIRAIQNDVPIGQFMKRTVSSAVHAMGTICATLAEIPTADVVSADTALSWEQLRRLWQIATTGGVVERKRGKWIEDNDVCECACPFCRQKWSYYDNDTDTFNFCPNCGADMREAVSDDKD